MGPPANQRADRFLALVFVGQAKDYRVVSFGQSGKTCLDGHGKSAFVAEIQHDQAETPGASEVFRCAYGS